MEKIKIKKIFIMIKISSRRFVFCLCRNLRKVYINYSEIIEVLNVKYDIWCCSEFYLICYGAFCAGSTTIFG